MVWPGGNVVIDASARLLDVQPG